MPPAISNACLFGGDIDAAQRTAIEQIVTANHISCVQLNECDRQSLTIRLIPLRTGRLCIDGVVGRLSVTNEPNSLWDRLRFDALAIRHDAQHDAGSAAAVASAQQQQQQQQQFDQKLCIDVLPALPSLQVQFSAVPDEVLAGEIIPVQVTMTNAGAVGLGEVWAATEQPRWVLGDDRELPLSVLKGEWCIVLVLLIHITIFSIDPQTSKTSPMRRSSATKRPVVSTRSACYALRPALRTPLGRTRRAPLPFTFRRRCARAQTMSSC